MLGHVPVLVAEVLCGLKLQPGALCIDCTLGGAGHAEAMLQATSPDGRLLGIDADPAAIQRAEGQLAPFTTRMVLIHGDFREVAAIARSHDFAGVQAILFDLGVSSFELADAERGFSFMAEGPLDMRMNPQGELTAADIINGWPEEALADVFFRYGEEHRSRRVARAIVAARPLQTTTELADVVSRALGGRRGGQHPATLVFQGLRIRVNDELAALEDALPQAVELLAPSGRLAVISFHSLEDRIVKHFMLRESQDCVCPPDAPACRCGHIATLRRATRKPTQPSAAELLANPRSRSAKLRIAERL